MLRASQHGPRDTLTAGLIPLLITWGIVGCWTVCLEHLTIWTRSLGEKFSPSIPKLVETWFVLSVCLCTWVRMCTLQNVLHLTQLQGCLSPCLTSWWAPQHLSFPLSTFLHLSPSPLFSLIPRLLRSCHLPCVSAGTDQRGAGVEGERNNERERRGKESECVCFWGEREDMVALWHRYKPSSKCVLKRSCSLYKPVPLTPAGEPTTWSCLLLNVLTDPDSWQWEANPGPYGSVEIWDKTLNSISTALYLETLTEWHETTTQVWS